jgi:hypothetical protein
VLSSRCRLNSNLSCTPATDHTAAITVERHRNVPPTPLMAVGTPAYRSHHTRLFPRDASTFAHACRHAILHRVRKQQPTPTPNWKEIILAGPDWPEQFDFPQTDSMPEGCEVILESTYFNEHWEWELWRQPDGKRYFLKAWPMDDGTFSDPLTPGAALTVAEAFQFLMTNWMPRDVIADLAPERPDIMIALNLLPNSPGLN